MTAPRHRPAHAPPQRRAEPLFSVRDSAPPKHVIEDRDRRKALAAAHEPSPNETLLGDPPPYRSALVRRT